MTRPVVLLAEELSPATIDALGEGFEIRRTDGTDRAALLRDAADADALLIRSATQADAEVFAAAPHLKVVARAGVGLDNVDVPAATAAGVMVINAPTSNIVSAAELAITHILVSLRKVARAHASVVAGAWERKKYTGTELFEKTVGVVGFGKIGQLVADRLTPFGVKLLAYDPYLSAARAAEHGARLVDLDELMRESDVVTVHMPKTPETIGLIGAEQFALAKPGLHIVNAARGGLIDEQALYEALSEGRIAGAGLDVYVTEPPADSPLLTLDSVTFTPHLGASTAEAQERAGVAVAQSVRLALGGELVPDAVNVAGGAIDTDVRPGIALADRLGQLFAALADPSLVRLEVRVRGEIAAKDVTAIKLSALRGLYRSTSESQVSYVNAPVIAEQRGVEVELVTDETTRAFRNEVTVAGAFADSTTLSVTGTLAGTDQVHKLTAIDDHDFDVPFTDNLIVYGYSDRPGMVGVVGTALGSADVNISAMQVSTGNDDPDRALVVLGVDAPVAPAIVSAIAAEAGIHYAKAVSIAY